MNTSIEVPPQSGKVYSDSWLDIVRRRYDRAEYAAVHVFNNSAHWFHYYGETADSHPFIADFRDLMKEVERLQSENSDLRYHLEAAGVNVDTKLKEDAT